MTKKQAENYLCEVLLEKGINLDVCGWAAPDVTCLGFCNIEKDGSYRLGFHPIILTYPKYLIRQIALHEIAHALKPTLTMKHGKAWLRQARELGYVFGAQIPIGEKRVKAHSLMVVRAREE